MGGEEKRASLSPPKGKKGKLGAPKGKRGNGGKHFCPLGNQAARTQTRTHGTTRNDFLAGLSPQPPIQISHARPMGGQFPVGGVAYASPQKCITRTKRDSGKDLSSAGFSWMPSQAPFRNTSCGGQMGSPQVRQITQHEPNQKSDLCKNIVSYKLTAGKNPIGFAEKRHGRNCKNIFAIGELHGKTFVEIISMMVCRSANQYSLRDHQYSLRDHQCGCRGGNRFVKGGIQKFD